MADHRPTPQSQRLLRHRLLGHRLLGHRPLRRRLFLGLAGAAALVLLTPEPAMAETTTAMRSPRRTASATRLAEWRIRSIDPTEVPPNLATTRVLKPVPRSFTLPRSGLDHVRTVSHRARLARQPGPYYDRPAGG